MPKRSVPKPLDFNWDLHNINKSWNKHGVNYKECEQAFINKPTKVVDDISHSQAEKRYTLFGQTNKARYLYITFTLRVNQIRVISARDMNKKERRFYEETKKSE